MRPSKSNCWTDLRPEADSRSRGSFAGVQCAAGSTVVDSNERGFAECKVQSLSILLSLLFNGIGILSVLFILLLTGTNLANGAGLTIVTHGFAVVVESKRPAWVSAMANDIAAVANKNGGNAAIYEMELARSTDFPFPVRVISFSLKSGQPPQQNPNSEVIIELYWNRLADNILVIGANSTGIATAVIPFLANATTVPDLPKPLAQLPIHLIGHSRGGSVVSEISRLLGEKGIWVDQVTTLDPHPVCFGETDADVGTYESVLYADNYYQRISGSPFCGAPSPNGVNVGGARERQLINLNGGYEGFTSDHSDVHLWYHGTVDTSQNASNGEKTIYDTMRDSWYLFSENGGKRAGFYYSRLGGGTVSSLGSGYYNNGDFNNSPANRFSLNRQIDEWPSLITLTHNSTSSVKAGNSFPTRCVIQSYDSGCSVEFYLDTDQNPYNNGEILLPISQAINPQPLTQRGTRTIDANVTVPAGTAPRSYYVYGKIVNPNGTRYRYSVTQVRVDSAAPSPFIITATTQTPNGAPTITIRTVTKSDPGVTYTIYRDGTTFNFSGTEFNNTTITPGATYHYFVRATDSAGLYTDSNTITVIAPNPGVPPNTTAPAAPEGLTVNPAPWSKLNLFSVSWANPTHPRNIVKVWYWIGNTPPGAGQGISRSLPQGNPLQVALPMQQGSSTLYVWLQDDQGNVSPVNYNSAALNLDPNAPIISPTIIPVSTSVSSAISINGTSSDDYSGIAGVTWVNDLGGNGIASVVKSVNGLSATWSVPSVQLASGVNRIKFTVTDNAGNAGHSTVTVNYFDTSNSGSLGVGIQPQGAVDAGAQWRLAGETVWRAPNIAASGIPAGNQTVEFKAVDGWITPLPASVSVVANLTVFLPVGSGTYGSGTVNQAPDVPSNPYPADGDVNISRSGLTLRWSGGHPTGSPDFAVAFDTVNPPGFIAGYGTVPGRTYSLAAREPLLPATTYYWRVQGKVGEQRTDGPVWRFTTDYSYADLIPYEIAVDGNIQPGANVTVRVKVKNQGTFTSAVSCPLKLYLSQTPQGKERHLNQFTTLYVPALAPGAEAELQQSVTLANLPAGQSFIDAWVDSAPYGINEQDYENNVRSLAIQYVDGQSPVVASARLGIPFVKTGQSNSIIYFATDDVGVKSMDFYYSVNGGVNWLVIQEGLVPPANLANGVILPWTIPTSLPLDTNLLVRVVARDASGNWGETNTIPYLIHNGTAPVVKVLFPNGGEALPAGSVQQIRWSISAPNGVGNASLTIYYDNNNTSTAQGITDYTTGTYSWTLPANLTTTVAKIRLTLQDRNGNTSEDWSDGPFSIVDNSQPPPAPWTAAAAVTSASTGDPAGTPRIVADSTGTLHLIYGLSHDATAHTISFRYRKRIGTTWTSPSVVSFDVTSLDNQTGSSYNIGNWRFTVDSNGHPHLVWATDYNFSSSEQSKSDIFYTTFDGVSWATPQNLSSSIRGPIMESSLAWATKANIPSASSSSAVVAVGGRLYFIYYDQIYEYNPAANTWTRKADAPASAVADGGATVVNGLIYAAGNYSDGTIRIYDPSANSWSTGAAMPLYQQGVRLVTAANGMVYAIGGDSQKTRMYNPGANSWNTMADMPTARSWPAVAAVGSKVYVIGGYQQQSMDVYDTVGNTWTTQAYPVAVNIRPSRGGFAVVANNKIYFVPGAQYGGAPDSASRDVWEYDPATGGWARMLPIQFEHGYGSGAAIGSKLYVLGGHDGFNAVSSMEEATLSTALAGTVSTAPQVAVDAANAVHVLWSDGSYLQPDGSVFYSFSSAGERNVYEAMKSGAGWSAPVQVTTGGVSRHAVVADQFGNLHLSHQSYNAGIGYRQRSGSSWSAPVFAGVALFGYGLDMAIDSTLKVHVLYSGYNPETALNELGYITFAGTAWSIPEIVTAIQSGFPPRLCLDSLNRPHAIWEGGSGNPQVLYSTRSGGGWVAPIQLNRASEQPAYGSTDAALRLGSNELDVVWLGANAGNPNVLLNYANVGSALDIYPPTVVVSSLVPADILPIGNPKTITWAASDNVGVTTIDLHFTTNNSATWTPIALNQANSGSFSWTVPDLGTNSAQVRVTARDAAGNAGLGFSGTFTTADLSPPTIALTTPAGSAILTGGSTTNINWVASDNVGVVRIDLEYSVDNGATWLGLATNLVNAGTYPWTVPSVPTSSLLLRASAQDAAGFSATSTSQPFTIVRGNSPPLAPYSPSPLDGSAFILTERPGFHWNSTDPDGDALTYQVRFGTNSSPPLVLTTSTLFFNPPALRPQRTYYWQVIASDGKATTPGPLWSFTTEAGVLPPTSLAEFKRQTNGYFEFRFDGLFGENQLVQASTNLLDWVTVATFASSNAASVFLDSTATNLHRRFYRVITP